MGTLFRIALRNVLRHRRRTIITAIVMTAGIATYIMFDSVLAGMDRVTIDTMIGFSKSSVKIRTAAYKENEQGFPLDAGVPNPTDVIATVEQSVPGARATSRTMFIARLSNYEDEIPVAAVAVNPVTDALVFQTASRVVSGSWLPTTPESHNALVLGRALAAELGLKVGDTLTVSASTVYDNVNADEFTVVGLVDTSDPQINRAGAFVAQTDADRLLGTLEYASEIDVSLPRSSSLDGALADSEKAASTLAPLLGGLVVDHLKTMAKDYIAMREMKSQYSGVIIFVVLLIAGVGIVNTVLMSVYSRIREIGVLRAYGLNAGEIGRLFRIEGLLVGLIGSVGGAILGILLDVYAINFGIPLPEMYSRLDLGGLPLSTSMYGEWNPMAIVFGILFGITVAWISASIPAAKASKLQVTDALRFV